MTGNDEGLVVVPPELPAGARSSFLLARALDRLDPHVEAIVEDFYARLLLRPAAADVVGRLTPEELTRLKSRQAEHVRGLLSPSVADDRAQERSREIGRIHAMVGVEMDLYAEAIAEHRRGLTAALRDVAGDVDLAAATGELTDRLMSDLHGALLGFRDIDDAQNRVMLRVIETVAEARTVADLARGVVEALSRLDGVVACFFARPDAAGRIHYEIGAGSGFDAFVREVSRSGPPLVLTEGSSPEAHGPIARAWRSGETVRSDSHLTDPTMEPWRPLARRFGWRSSAAVPLTDRRGTSLAVLSLQAGWPGYFASTARRGLLDQVRQAVERSLADLEERPALTSGVSGYTDRRSNLARLAAGEVVMLFQPVVSLPEGRVTKLEALARLRAEDRLVGPAEFLPAFGEDELFRLFDLGLRQAVAALRRWEGEGLRTGVSVNLPVASVTDDRYVRLVREVLVEQALEPGRLTLELLETGFVDRESVRRHRCLDEFQALGVRLSQDDLGSGYSSLLRLRHFSFDEVKIDRSLVQGTDLSPGLALGFIQPITDIAHGLGLHVVIEGLEDDGLIEAALHLGADAGQGYGIAFPMPAEEVVAWAREFRIDVDAREPRHPIGALAAHVAWEHRVAALEGHPGRDALLGISTCPLAGYLTGPGGDAALVAAHEVVHATALSHRGSDEHRDAWARLAAGVTSR